MPYIEETVIAGRTIEITKKHSCKYINKKMARSEKKNDAPEDLKKRNERNAETNLRRLINTNFKYQDIHLVLTYKKENRPTTTEGAKRDLEKFLRKLRTYFKKRNIELKYIAVTEYENKAIHHHLIINSMDTRDLTDLWTHGQPRPTYLDNSGQYGQLASYLIKETSKKFNSAAGVHKKRWCASKNLKKPEISRRIISSSSWSKNLKPKKGYYIEKGSERFGIHEVTGYQYQFYRMIKIQNNENER